MSENTTLLYVAVVGALGSILVSVFNLIQARTKPRGEAEKDKAEAASVLTGAALEIVEGMQTRMDALEAEIGALEREMEALEKENKALRSENRRQRVQIQEQEQEILQLNGKIDKQDRRIRELENGSGKGK